METPRRWPNQLGLKGWAVGGRWRQERWLYTLHRLSGLAILGYFLLHVLVTSTRAGFLGGEAAWTWLMGTFSETRILGLAPFKWGELGIYVAFCFHALNGLRLTLCELGFGIGPPEEPVYPYRSSMDVQAPLAFLLMLVAGALATVGFWNFLQP